MEKYVKTLNELTGDLYTNEQKRDMFDYLDCIEMADEDNDMDSDILIDIYNRKFLAIYYNPQNF